MSREFVKEPGGDQVSDDQPELPINTHQNYITIHGFEQLNSRHAKLLNSSNN